MANVTSNESRGPPLDYHASQLPPYPGQAVAVVEYSPEHPPYHNWQEAVPDTTTFPPPPVTGFLSSNTGNACSDDAERAHEFCGKAPLHLPAKPSAAVYSSVQQYDLRPVQPGEFRGVISPISQGRWQGSTMDGCGDCLLSTNLPLYFPINDSPFVTERSKTVYFEVKLLGLREGPGPSSSDSSGFSIGFVAHPYPYWRSPGWERGSLGVFSDDGCRFVNDSWGGKEFTTPFSVGETVGLGMVFCLPYELNSMPEHRDKKCRVNVFFTRNGKQVGSWDLHEEVDEDGGNVEGLEGDFDLYGAIGFFGGVDFETRFDQRDWLWKPQ
ncbi:hypothetical protein BBP40_012367 [Aspergillus hancockii]|nr:hypothetical protein BBP40_012367 [Aspergillus hancockii]